MRDLGISRGCKPSHRERAWSSVGRICRQGMREIGVDWLYAIAWDVRKSVRPRSSWMILPDQKRIGGQGRISRFPREIVRRTLGPKPLAKIRRLGVPAKARGAGSWSRDEKDVGKAGRRAKLDVQVLGSRYPGRYRHVGWDRMGYNMLIQLTQRYYRMSR